MSTPADTGHDSAELVYVPYPRSSGPPSEDPHGPRAYGVWSYSAYGPRSHGVHGLRPRGAGTVALHVRIGLNRNALSAGVLTAGTAAGAEDWAGTLIAPRGAIVLVDLAGETDSAATAPEWTNDTLGALVRNVLRAAHANVQRWLLAHPGPDVPHLGHGEQTITATDNDEEPATAPLALEALARSLADAPAAVRVARPAVPALTGEPLEDVRRLFALTVSQLAELLGVTERQAHRYLREGLPDSRRPLADALVAVGLTVVGGLGPDGARAWLFSGRPTAAELAVTGRLDELRKRADALRDSPAT